MNSNIVKCPRCGMRRLRPIPRCPECGHAPWSWSSVFILGLFIVYLASIGAVLKELLQ